MITQRAKLAVQQQALHMCKKTRPAVSGASLCSERFDLFCGRKACKQEAALLDEPLHMLYCSKAVIFADAEIQATISDADAAPPAPPARALRSRRGHADAAPAKSAQGSAGSQQFPSPPKTRAGRKRNQAASKPAAASASTRRGKKAAQHQAETADQDDSVQQPDVSVHQQSAEADVLDQRISSAREASVANSPVAVLATASSLGRVYRGHNSDQQQQEILPAEASAAFPSVPVDSSPDSSTEDQEQPPELGVGSTSRHRKRKQSAVGESLAAPNSKRQQPGTAQEGQTDSPDAGSPASAHQSAAQKAVSAMSTPRGTDNGLQSQPDQLQSLANDTDMSSLQAREQQQHLHLPVSPAIPVTAAQSLVVADSVPEASAEPDADAGNETAMAAPPVNARNSDYQDAQERVSSPLHVSPDPARSQGEQRGKTSPLPMHEGSHQAPAVSTSRPDPTEEQEAVEAANDAPDALHVAEALPASANGEPEEDALATAGKATAEVEGNAVAAAPGFDAADADSNVAAQADISSVLGAAAAVPLPSSTHEGMPLIKSDR